MELPPLQQAEQAGLRTPGEHRSLWQARAQAPSFPALDRDLETDVLVIGGGVAGLTTAAFLSHNGVRVAVVEALTLGGQTGRSTGWLTEMVDGEYAQIEKDFGREGAVMVKTAARNAIEEARRLCERYAPRANYQKVPAYYYPVDASEKERRRVADEADAAERAGVHVERDVEVPAPYPVPPGAFRVPDQAQFDPLAYVHGLAEGLAREGVQIFERTRLETPHGGDNPSVRTEDHRFTIRARKIVQATHSPLGVSTLHTQLVPYRSYVVGFTLPEGEQTDAMLFDSGENYVYVRTFREGGELILVVGGADHKTGHGGKDDGPYRQLVDWTAARYPQAEPRFRWSGQWFEPVDGIPYIGEMPLTSNVYCATGFSGDGLTWGIVSGRILADLARGVESPYAETFSPRRFTPSASALEWAKHNVEVTADLVIDRFEADVQSADELAPGEGGLLFHGAHHLAVFRDEAGRLHALSPVCSHTHCVVKWNGADRTWDCPCHGSRFDPTTGEVLESPANEGLGKREVPS